MATIITQGEMFRRAVQWISDQAIAENKHPRTFVNEAITKFCLTPQDETLIKTFFPDDSKESK